MLLRISRFKELSICKLASLELGVTNGDVAHDVVGVDILSFICVFTFWCQISPGIASAKIKQQRHTIQRLSSSQSSMYNSDNPKRLEAQNGVVDKFSGCAYSLVGGNTI